MMPDLYSIAGPNGAGKTTAAYTFLPRALHIKQFVNADEIARGISPFDPESVAIQAGKVMLQRIDHLLTIGASFAIETTLTTLSYLRTIERAKLLRYKVSLLFVWLDKPEAAVERVQQRVAAGGHHIPPDVIHRRYIKGLINLPRFIEVMDNWYIYDNSDSFYELIGQQENGTKRLLNFDTYRKIFPNEQG
jgi:predicted ABC-type ATPase